MGDKFRILSCDGGGIRGLIPAVWLSALEGRVGSLDRRFDLVAGTSTGSILAGAIGVGLPMPSVVDLYVRRGPEVFLSGWRLWLNRFGRTFRQGLSAPKHSSKGLRKTLREGMGSSTLLKHVSTRLMLFGYDTDTPDLKVYKSWREEDGFVKLYEAVCASCSAPTYFAAHRVSGNNAVMDGGIGVFNRSVCPVAETVRLGVALDDIVLVSMGTGEKTTPVPRRVSMRGGVLQWAPHAVDAMLHAQARAAAYCADKLVAPGNYFRCQVPLGLPSDAMDDASSKNLSLLQAEAHRWLKSGGDLALDLIASKL
jgi:patatin-like phospholipase/acyl hydrolase